MNHALPDDVYTVASLTAHVRDDLREGYDGIRVVGEISQPRTPRSGHVYLTLKDRDAVLPCVIWRSAAARMRVPIEEGLEVVASGGLDVYLPHGRYQFIIRTLEPVGAGARQLAFERLRKALAEEGLFEVERKQPLPPFPRRIALITSKTGAAVRDMVEVISRRMPGVTLLLLPVRVQGEGAADEIASALLTADAEARADVIIVGRGGGSLEDLWAFNEEMVARAIAACATPVISAVGHETDTTIADLVADVRAATPSHAGELVVPDARRLHEQVRGARHRLGRALRRVLDTRWQKLEALAERPVLRRPGRFVEERQKTLTYLGARLRAARPKEALARRRALVEGLGARLHPPVVSGVLALRERVEQAAARQRDQVVRATHARRESVERLALRLRALSPLRVLARGYSLTERVEDADANGGRVLTSTDAIGPGDRLRTRVGGGGIIESAVTRIVTPSSEDPA